MKKIIVLAFVAFLGTASAQTNTTSSGTSNLQAPSVVTDRYSTDYPNTTPTWSMDGDNYRADYMDNSTNLGRSVIYDKKGTRISTESQINQGGYPAAVSDYYSKNYPNETYQVWLSEEKGNDKKYYIKRETETVWFDKEGNYKSKTKIKTAKAK